MSVAYVRRAVGALLREPLFHFLCIGLLLFLAYHVIRNEGDRTQIVVDEAVVADIERRHAAIWHRPPSAIELHALVDGWIREEVFYRKGVELQLDRDDPVVRRRVRQKLDVLAEEWQLSEAPAEAELNAWLAAHSSRYALAPVLSFEQVLIQPQGQRTALAQAAAGARERLRRGADPAAISASRMLPVSVSDTPTTMIAREFGDEFAAALRDLPLGDWHGPIRSAYGMHLVKLTSCIPGRLPALEEVRTQVMRDVENERRKQASEEFYAELRKQFDIRMEVDLPTRRLAQ